MLRPKSEMDIKFDKDEEKARLKKMLKGGSSTAMWINPEEAHFMVSLRLTWRGSSRGRRQSTR